jgi:hypothetical protein
MVAILLAGTLVAASAGVARADEIGTPSTVAAAPSQNVLLSADGSYVVYSSGALYGRSTAGGPATTLSDAVPDRFRLDVSADGTIVGFITAAGDAHVVNRQRGTDEIIATGLAARDVLYVAQAASSVWYAKTIGSTTSLFVHDAAAAATAPNLDAALPLAGSPEAFAVDWQGSRLLYSTPAGRAVRQFTAADGTDRPLFDWFSLIPDDNAISPSGRYLAAGLAIIDITSGQIVSVATAGGGAGGFVRAMRPRFSLDERSVVVAGIDRPGAWLFSVQSGLAHRVSHADDLSTGGKFPISVDPTGSTVAYTSLVSASPTTGLRYGTFTSPVQFDTTPPQLEILNPDGDQVTPENPVRMHVTDGGSGIDRVSVRVTSPTKPTVSFSFTWTDGLNCVRDQLGVADDRDCSASFGGYASGELDITTQAFDVDGNSSPPQTVRVFGDSTPPTVTGAPDRPANAAGWYKSPVTINWTATDPDSNVTNPPATRVSSDGKDQTVRSAQVCDQASLCATGSYTLNMDQLRPSVIATPTAQPGNGGWYTSPTQVQFACSDALSGVASCPAAVTVSTEGRDQTVRGTGVDVAGNSTDASASLSIDMTAPSTTVTSSSMVVATLNQQLTGNAADALSGVARLYIEMTNGSSTVTLSSDLNTVALACDAGRTTCTWSARPPLRGQVAVRIWTYDVAGNLTTTGTSAVVI